MSSSPSARRPVFVDIDPLTRNIDLERIEAAHHARHARHHSRWIWPACRWTATGLYTHRPPTWPAGGRGCGAVDGQPLERSAASAHIGDLVSFSFHANKNITTIEGGCLVLNDEREAQLAEQYRLQGVVRSGFDGMEVELAGGKFNLTDVAARVGLGQLPHLAQFNARRRELARAYFAELRARGAASSGWSCRWRTSPTATGTCSRSCCPRSA